MRQRFINLWIRRRTLVVLVALAAASVAGAGLAKLTTPVTGLYVPRPSTALLIVTPLMPGVSCSVKVGVFAVFALMLVKLTEPVTEVPTGALAGKPAKLALMSAVLPVTLKVAVLFAALVSFKALVVPVPATAVLLCV